ncbi:MAG: LLM class flavin-dependent oxidoreductase, partial [Thermomicrobiales bacterium]
FVPSEYTRRAIERVRADALESGRPEDAVEIAASLVVSADPDGDPARDAVRPAIATYLADFPSIAKESGIADDLRAKIWEAHRRGGAAAAAPLITDETVADLSCSGTVDECRHAIEGRRRSGVRLPNLSFAHGDATRLMESLSG